MTTTRCRWWLPAVCVWSACAGTMMTPEQRVQEERRLLSPFLAAREVGCGELLVEVTGNLYAYVGQPAVDDARILKTKEPGDGYVDTVYTCKAPDAAMPIRITIGEAQQRTAAGVVVLGRQTTFKVINQARVRVYEDRRPITLNATAGGAFVLVKDAANDRPREFKKFAVVDGVMQKQ